MKNYRVHQAFAVVALFSLFSSVFAMEWSDDSESDNAAHASEFYSFHDVDEPILDTLVVASDIYVRCTSNLWIFDSETRDVKTKIPLTDQKAQIVEDVHTMVIIGDRVYLTWFVRNSNIGILPINTKTRRREDIISFANTEDAIAGPMAASGQYLIVQAGHTIFKLDTRTNIIAKCVATNENAEASAGKSLLLSNGDVVVFEYGNKSLLKISPANNVSETIKFKKLQDLIGPMIIFNDSLFVAERHGQSWRVVSINANTGEKEFFILGDCERIFGMVSIGNTIYVGGTEASGANYLWALKPASRNIVKITFEKTNLNWSGLMAHNQMLYTFGSSRGGFCQIDTMNEYNSLLMHTTHNNQSLVAVGRRVFGFGSSIPQSPERIENSNEDSNSFVSPPNDANWSDDDDL